MRAVLMSLAAVALVVVLVIGLTQAGGGDEPSAETPRFDLEAAQQRLADAPPPLADLYEQANELVPGGLEAFQARMDELEGRPAVVNLWASWCGPCRSEFPIFQQVATRRGTEVAFLGVNSADKRPAAEKFLGERPLPYPSYEDPDADIAAALEAPRGLPMTVFLDRRGRTEFIKAGEYRSAADLEADIDRYLGA